MPFSVSNSDISLSYSNIQNCAFRFTSVLTGNIVVSPAGGDATTYFNGFYYFENLTTGNFSITVTTGAGSVVLPQSRRGIMFVDGTNGPRIFSIVDSSGTQPIPSGTVMLFYQNAAPTGWTISSSLDDYALKIVSSAGGVTSGSVNYSTLFARTATDSYTLQIADIPAHTHTTTQQMANTLVNTGSGGSLGSLWDTSSGLEGAGRLLNQANPPTSSSTGGGGSHSHGLDMRVKTASFIMASKN